MRLCPCNKSRAQSRLKTRYPQQISGCPIPPDFLWGLVDHRTSCGFPLKKAAHATMASAVYRKSRYLTRFWSDVGNAALNAQFSCKANRRREPPFQQPRTLFNNRYPCGSAPKLLLSTGRCNQPMACSRDANLLVSTRFVRVRSVARVSSGQVEASR